MYFKPSEGRFAFGFNPSPVADHHHFPHLELLFQQADLRSQGRGIGGVALEDAHCQGLSIGSGEQTHDDLFFSALAIAVVAIGGEFIVLALQVT
jgi:hypothetical protein